LFVYSIQDQCFYQLRTVQQLGYVAFCRNRVNEGVGSFEVSTSYADDYHDELRLMSPTVNHCIDNDNI